MRRTARLVLAAGLALGGGAAVSAPAEAAACSTTSGVTVVVTFPGGRTSTRCAPGDPGSGFAALSGAGFAVTPVQRFPGALCRIDGTPASDPCVNMPPTSAYWSYWHASRGGSWSYSTLGAGSHDPAPGSVEGWSFGSGGAPAVAPPPPIVTPRPTTTPRPSTTSPRPRPSTTTARPRPSTTSPRPRPTTPGALPRPTTPSARPTVVVTADGTPRAAPGPPAPPAPRRAAPPSAATTSASAPAASSTSAAPDGTTTAAEATNADAAAPAAAPASTPWSLVAGALAIAALAVTAFAARRRRATH